LGQHVPGFPWIDIAGMAHEITTPHDVGIGLLLRGGKAWSIGKGEEEINVTTIRAARSPMHAR
jgi:hypothetical protein